MGKSFNALLRTRWAGGQVKCDFFFFGGELRKIKNNCKVFEKEANVRMLIDQKTGLEEKM